MSETTWLFLIGGGVVVAIAFFFRRSLKAKVDVGIASFEVDAEGHAPPAPTTSSAAEGRATQGSQAASTSGGGSRNVTIGGNANGAVIVTGDENDVGSD